MMKLAVLQSEFYKTIKDDSRINSTHISLYMALLHDYSKNRFHNPVVLKRNEVMEKAKVSSRVTYNKCMKELHEYGYIEYLPSYNIGASKVIIKEPKVSR